MSELLSDAALWILFLNHKPGKAALREKVSVAMAAYNGEKYIKRQIETILVNLSEGDELIVSDDGSTDSTKEIVSSFKDSRIVLIDGPGAGVKKNFENAILHCTGKYIFLCDQDDEWANNKVSRIMDIFERTGDILVIHDCRIIDSKDNVIVPSFFEFRKSGPGRIKNFVKNTYIGCCMAFDSDLKDYFIPIPDRIEMHDQWIGILAQKRGHVSFIKEPLIDYRRHGENTSDVFHHHTVLKMISNRLNLLAELLKRG